MDDQYRHGPSLLESLWRYRLAIFAGALLMGVLGYVLGTQQTPTYDASARLFLTDPARTPGLADNARNRVNPAEFIPQQAARVTSRAVFAAARETLSSPPSISDMQGAITIRESPEDLSLRITAAAADPEDAAALANAMAAAFMDLTIKQGRDAADRAVVELDQQVAQLEARLTELEAQLAGDTQNLAIQSQIQNLSLRLIDLDRVITTVRIEAELRGDGVDVFEQAEAPRSPARPQLRRQALLFAVLGGFLAALWAYWQAGRSQRVVHRTDAEPLLGAPLLGEIPLYRSVPGDALNALLTPDPAVAEAYEFVLSSIEFALGDIGGKSVLITSTLPGDGKTTAAMQLGIAASRDGRRVVLVDGDIRAHGLTRVLEAEDRPGLSDIVLEDLRPSDVMRRYRFSEQSQVPVVTAGQRRGDPAALFRTKAFRQVMRGISEAAELVVVDTSPLLAVADATIVAASTDGIILVVRHGTPFRELQKVRERLKFISTPLLGYIFNRSQATTAAAYGYGYGVVEDRDGKRRLLPRLRGARRPDPRQQPQPTTPAQQSDPEVAEVGEGAA